MKNCFEELFFWHFVFSNFATTNVFGWFALGIGTNKSEKKTGIYDPCNAPCQKTLQYNCFLRMNQKNV